jgi:copper chaperone CopZ
MLRYVVTDLYEDTPQDNRQKLIAALEDVEGIKDVALDVTLKEVRFGISGPEPKLAVLKQACADAGFSLGIRM